MIVTYLHAFIHRIRKHPIYVAGMYYFHSLTTCLPYYMLYFVIHHLYALLHVFTLIGELEAVTPQVAAVEKTKPVMTRIAKDGFFAQQ